jgi:hypothetical protein
VYVTTDDNGFTSVARITTPRIVTSLPICAALMSRTAVGLIVRKSVKYTSLKNKNVVRKSERNAQSSHQVGRIHVTNVVISARCDPGLATILPAALHRFARHFQTLVDERV